MRFILQNKNCLILIERLCPVIFWFLRYQFLRLQFLNRRYQFCIHICIAWTWLHHCNKKGCRFHESHNLFVYNVLVFVLEYSWADNWKIFYASIKWGLRLQPDAENFRFDSDAFHSASGTSAYLPSQNDSIKSSSFCSIFFRSSLSSKQSIKR